MNNLLESAKKNSGIPSNNQLAIALNVSPERVSKWNLNKAKPNGEQALILADLAGVTPKEALRLMQGGFSSVSLLTMTALGSTLAIAGVWCQYIVYYVK